MPRHSEAKVVHAVVPRKRVARKPGVRRIKGQGDYTLDKPGPWGKFGRQVGGYAGNLLASPYGLGSVGGRIGSKLGSYLHYIGKIFGSGDYVTSPMNVQSNSLLSSQIPEFIGAAGYTKIRHREYLGDVFSSSSANTFKIDSYAINPGVSTTFPWLSQVCGASYQQYRTNGMCFEFRSTSSDALNSTNTALGSVVMATDYDSKDAVFATKQQMENTEFGVSCKPSQCMLHAIECAKNKTSVSEQYIRMYDVPDGADIRLYDLGRFSIASTGCQGTSVNLGELWVSYDIDLIKPIEQPSGFSSPCAYYGLSTTNTAPLGASGTQVVDVDQIGLTFTENRIQFPYNIPVGSKWAIQFIVQGDSTAITAPTVTYNKFSGGAPFAIQTPTGTTTTFIGSYWITYPGGATPADLPYVNIADTTFPANPTVQNCLYVTQVGAGMPDNA